MGNPSVEARSRVPPEVQTQENTVDIILPPDHHGVPYNLTYPRTEVRRDDDFINSLIAGIRAKDQTHMGTASDSSGS